MGIPITGRTIFFLSFFFVCRESRSVKWFLRWQPKKRIFCESVFLRLKKNQIRTLGGMVDNKRVRTRSVPFFLSPLWSDFKSSRKQESVLLLRVFPPTFFMGSRKRGRGRTTIRYMSCRLLSPLFPTTDFFF